MARLQTLKRNLGAKLVIRLPSRRKTVSRHVEPPEMRNRADFIQTEVFGPHYWEPRISSGGVSIMVARLGKSALVRKAA